VKIPYVSYVTYVASGGPAVVSTGEPSIDGPVRVAVADGSWHYARALEATLTLQPDIDIVGIAYAADELIELVRTTAVDVIVVEDLVAAERLRSEQPDASLLMVSAAVDRERARRCIALGIRGYVVKRDRHDPERIAAAVRSIASGSPFFDREVQEFLLDLASRAPNPALEAGLTSRELEVLPLAAEGLGNRDLASRLGVSEQTIRNHLSNIYRKLGARNRTQMAAEARRRGIFA
jgi:DNA-binding NarL/FixJ family response regulator